MNNEYMKLTDQERAEMRSEIRFFMAEYPVRRTFLERLFSKTQSSVPGVTYMQPALAGFLIVLLVGGSTTYAAAEALPGDLLYPIKVSVNEPIVGALAISSEAKAKWNATLAARRLGEAGTLALEGRLTPEARAIIEDNFEKQTEAFEDNTEALTREEDRVEVAADVQSYMEVSLKAYADVLSELTEISEAEPELRPILEKVESRVLAVESARASTEEVIAAKVGKDIEAAAEVKKRLAEREVGRKVTRGERARGATQSARVKAPEPAAIPAPEIATMSAAVEDTASTSFNVEAEIELREEEQDEASEAFQDGSQKFKEGKPGEAFTAFQKALRAVEKEKLDEDIRKQFNIGTEAEQNWQEKE